MAESPELAVGTKFKLGAGDYTIAPLSEGSPSTAPFRLKVKAMTPDKTDSKRSGRLVLALCRITDT
jgi:hypothetical protein